MIVVVLVVMQDVQPLVNLLATQIVITNVLEIVKKAAQRSVEDLVLELAQTPIL